MGKRQGRKRGTVPERETISSSPGELMVVGNPIGHPGDITRRAEEALG